MLSLNPHLRMDVLVLVCVNQFPHSFIDSFDSDSKRERVFCCAFHLDPIDLK